MTESAMFLSDASGDGGPYSADTLRLLWKSIGVTPAANEGVLPRQLNELRPSTTGNNSVTIATGRALCDGVLYQNDAAKGMTVTSPVVGTTGKRIVLRRSWAANTVRLTEVSSADGTATIPALSQTDGTTWDIPICSFTITTGGVIGALTDTREFTGVGFSAPALTRLIAASRVIVAWSDFGVLSGTSPGLAWGDGLGMAKTFSSSAYAYSADAANGRIDMGSAASANTYALAQTGAAACRGNLNPRFAASLIPQAANAALYMQMFGFFEAQLLATGTGNNKACIRSTTTGNLFFVTGDGASEQTTDLGVAPATQTHIEIWSDDAGVTWHCALNGIIVATHSTTVPAAGTNMYGTIGIRTNTTTAMTITNLDYLLIDQDRS